MSKSKELLVDTNSLVNLLDIEGTRGLDILFSEGRQVVFTETINDEILEGFKNKPTLQAKWDSWLADSQQSGKLKVVENVVDYGSRRNAGEDTLKDYAKKFGADIDIRAIAEEKSFITSFFSGIKSAGSFENALAEKGFSDKPHLTVGGFIAENIKNGNIPVTEGLALNKESAVDRCYYADDSKLMVAA